MLKTSCDFTIFYIQSNEIQVIFYMLKYKKLYFTCENIIWNGINSAFTSWNWQKMTAWSGSSQQLTIKKGAPGDQVLDLLCVQLTSYPEGGPFMWMTPLHLHVNQKSNSDYMMILCRLLWAHIRSNAYNFLFNSGQKHKVWVFIFLIGSQRTFW